MSRDALLSTGWWQALHPIISSILWVCFNIMIWVREKTQHPSNWPRIIFSTSMQTPQVVLTINANDVRTRCRSAARSQPWERSIAYWKQKSVALQAPSSVRRWLRFKHNFQKMKRAGQEEEERWEHHTPVSTSWQRDPGEPEPANADWGVGLQVAQGKP